MIEYFYNTKIHSPISDVIFRNLNNYEWWPGPRKNQWQPKYFDQNLINLDPFLKKFHPKLKGYLNLFKFYPNTYYDWHCDGIKEFNFNLPLKHYERSFIVFEKINQNVDIIHRNSKEIVELEYQPLTWHIFNAQIPHTIFNLDKEPRYILTYNISKEIRISYKDFISMAGLNGLEPSVS